MFYHGQHRVHQISYRKKQCALPHPTTGVLAEGVAQQKPVIPGPGIGCRNGERASKSDLCAGQECALGADANAYALPRGPRRQ